MLSAEEKIIGRRLTPMNADKTGYFARTGVASDAQGNCRANLTASPMLSSNG
jgi:hypothetical protein